MATSNSINYGSRVIPNANARKHVASLARRFGASRATAILHGTDPEASKLRSSKLIPEDLDVSLPTVLGIAQAHGVELKRGRRPQTA